jgi:GNAT superfamily N-acetyltransferase
VTGRIEITRLNSLPTGLETLRIESAREGFGFLDRLVADWTRGTNTFSRPGEGLLGAYADGQLVGIGGLNADPYLPGTDVGRIRHVYVQGVWRHQGVGRALIDCLVREAGGLFSELRLRTVTADAAAFYVRCGFNPVDDPSATHWLKLGGCPKGFGTPASQPESS